jgi:hypothetical protein
MSDIIPSSPTTLEMLNETSGEDEHGLARTQQPGTSPELSHS